MSQRRKILIVDDEPHIVELLSMNLRQNGFDQCSATNGAEALEVARAERPDLILLDLMLPGMSGLEVCRLLKQDPLTAGTLVIMLTARSEETDKVIGLGIGADDYVTKPFGLRELIARIEAALRRSAPGVAPSAPAPGPSLRIGELVIDEDGREILRKDGRVPLSPTEFALVSLLARNRGRAVRRGDFLREMGYGDDEASGRSLDVHVRNLRKKLGLRPEGGEYIETIRGIGYRLHG